MEVLRRIRHLGSLTGRAVWLVVSRQYLSLITAGVLAVLVFLVLTSDSFESRDSDATQDAASIWEPKPRRPTVLFYVVNDETQRDEIAAAMHADRYAFDAGVAPPDYVVYLIAGTKEEEERTIARLNFEELAARQSGADMRVIDVRGRFD